MSVLGRRRHEPVQPQHSVTIHEPLRVIISAAVLVIQLPTGPLSSSWFASTVAGANNEPTNTSTTIPRANETERAVILFMCLPKFSKYLMNII